jgi:Flp pilus assembly pilin Flp
MTARLAASFDAPDPRPSPGGGSPQPSAGRIGKDEQGLASVEYAIVLIAVSIGVAASLIVLGSTVAGSFDWQVAVLGLPFP